MPKIDSYLLEEGRTSYATTITALHPTSYGATQREGREATRTVHQALHKMQGTNSLVAIALLDAVLNHHQK